MPFGPDNNLPLNSNVAFDVTVPPRSLLRMSFAFDAAWENAICIYRGDAKVLEKGNYSRDRGDWAYINTEPTAVVFRVTGWHKRSRPNSGEPWYQSLGKVLRSGPTHPELIGFEDGADQDYNDSQCVVQILGPA